MRILANLFLLLFLADGGLSLVDEVLRTLAGTAALTSIRQPVALAVMALAILLFFVLGIDRRLPKRIFLPLIAFALWGAVGFWPLSVTVDYTGFSLLAAAGQLLLGLSMILWLRHRSGGRLLLSQEMLSGPLFCLGNSLKFAAVSLVLFPFALVFFGLGAVGMYLEQQTAGFMRLTPAGIYMTERIYRQGGKTIRLAGMMHVGKEEYYQDLADSVTFYRTLVLAEGVSDNDHLLQNRFDYSGVGEALGLVSQNELNFNGRPITLDEIDRPFEEGEASVPHILRADVDINRFDPRTVEFLNMLGKTLLNRDAAGSSLTAYNAWAVEHMTPELMRTLMADILDRRNSELVRILFLTIDKYDTIVIPWGALHMPGIEAAVLDQGFHFAAQQRQLSLDFKTLPYGKLLGRLAGATEEVE
jgi:hypothetical protein